MKPDIHTTTLRLPEPLWDAVRFVAYLKHTSANGAIIQILEEVLPNHLDSLEYNMLDWQPNSPEIEKQLRPEFKKHQKNLHDLKGET